MLVLHVAGLVWDLTGLTGGGKTTRAAWVINRRIFGSRISHLIWLLYASGNAGVVYA